MKIFSFVGWSGSGKTMLIKKLIKEYKKNNKNVISIKLIKNKYNIEPESKDSYKFLESGSNKVFLVSKNQIMEIKKINEIEDFYNHIKNLETDYVLIEGYTTNKNIKKIEVFDKKVNDQLKYASDIVAIVSDDEIISKKPIFKKNEIPKIIDFMENVK